MRQRFQPRVTVAAVIERNGRFLLIEEETSEGLRLNNPAGHLDPGESPAEGCARETLEETAHLFTPTALVGVYLSRRERPGGGGSSAEFAAFIAREQKIWKEIVRKAQIKPD